jgi:hypothetical protein
VPMRGYSHAMADPKDGPGVVDASGLSDADWAEINRLRRVFESGGTKEWSKAVKALCEADPTKALKVLGAYFPNEVRETTKDAMAELGVTEEDIREILRKAPGKRH